MNCSLKCLTTYDHYTENSPVSGQFPTNFSPTRTPYHEGIHRERTLQTSTYADKNGQNCSSYPLVYCLLFIYYCYLLQCGFVFRSLRCPISCRGRSSSRFSYTAVPTLDICTVRFFLDQTEMIKINKPNWIRPDRSKQLSQTGSFHFNLKKNETGPI